MVYDNLAGSRVYKPDGNTRDESTSTAPRVAVIGVAAKGQGNRPYLVQTTSLARAEFGLDGNLIRGMFEAKQGGAQEVYLYRIGATQAVVSGIGNSGGGAGGYTITTYEYDDEAGSLYEFYYDDATDRLVIRRVSDEVIIFDNSESAPIDTYEIIVSGYRSSGGGGDVGSPSSFVVLEDVTGTGITYTAGTDGLSLSRMEMYEKLDEAYEHLLEYNFDSIVPMDVYLDDYNTKDQGHYLGAVVPLSDNGSNTYPTAGDYKPGVSVDSLGMLYKEEYEGRTYYWWRFATSGVTADIYPTGVGSASATTTIDGTILTASDFHEVNFAYQLGRFLYDYSTDIVDANGVIGVLPPASDYIVDRARWLGKEPTWTLNSSTGVWSITSALNNGSGLLGNKFMAGRYDHRSGVFGGGFILTDGDYLDAGSEVVDGNEVPVDLGKYISIVTDYPRMRNSYDNAGYLGSLAATYAGFYNNLPVTSSPTNKVIPNVDIIFRQKLGNLNKLAKYGYTVLRNKERGNVIANALMATLPNSDWKNLSTVRIVKAIVDAVREAADPYIGDSLSAGRRGALEEAIEKILVNAKKIGSLKKYGQVSIIQTPEMAVAGRATVTLNLNPAFELKSLEITVNVTKN